MFFPESRVRVYLYGQAVDMRKSFDGLYAVARTAFAQDPTGGDLYVFVNRSGRQIKVLYFDRSGWCVWAKRLEAGQFIGDWSQARTREIDCTQLKLLLEGIEPRRYLKRYRRHSSGDQRHEHHPSHSGARDRGQGNSDHSRGAQFGACVAWQAMSEAVLTRMPDAAELAAMDSRHVAQLLRSQAAQIEALRAQIEWFRRQIFGQKSERYAPLPDAQQMHLGELMPGVHTVPEAEQDVPAHKRRKARSDFTDDAAGVPFFDEAKVAVVNIEVPNPEVQGLSPEQVARQFEVVGQKVSHRLAQRPGAYVVLKYVRSVIKRRDTQTLHCPSAPVGVIEGSRADVSFIAGVLVDKFQWHLPLYRQHQRLTEAGFKLSRPWLTQLVAQGAQLLEPIYDAQLESIRRSRVKAVDETPIKAGRAGPGKMRCGYFWPVYGEHDEVCFAFFESRQHGCVKELLGGQPQQGAVLLSDGYAAYSRYAEATGVTHAQCWAHTRRGFFEALGAAPQEADCALKMIAQVYEVEAVIREQSLSGERKRLHRLEHAKPLVEQFFAWVDEQLAHQGLLPSNKLTQALAYARERKAQLMVFLGDEHVPMDTNHLERALRPIPIGRKNWLFCWTEVGAKHAGIVQSLITTCRLHGIEPYTYFVDVLQRVGQHPASRVAELTPRLWKQRFAEQPLRSDLHGIGR